MNNSEKTIFFKSHPEAVVYLVKEWLQAMATIGLADPTLMEEFVRSNVEGEEVDIQKVLKYVRVFFEHIHVFNISIDPEELAKYMMNK